MDDIDKHIKRYDNDVDDGSNWSNTRDAIDENNGMRESTWEAIIDGGGMDGRRRVVTSGDGRGEYDSCSDGDCPDNDAPKNHRFVFLRTNITGK